MNNDQYESEMHKYPTPSKKCESPFIVSERLACVGGMVFVGLTFSLHYSGYG
jgi:hypothetical protein